jgi:hypothetical protein
MTYQRGMLHSFRRRLAGEALSSLAGVVGNLIPEQQFDCLRRSGRLEFSGAGAIACTALQRDGAPGAGGTASAREIQDLLGYGRLLPSQAETARGPIAGRLGGNCE